MTQENSVELTLPSGKEVVAHYEAEYAINDHGIGAYEYWGARCVDRDLRVDLEGYDITCVHLLDDEDEDNILDSLSKEDKDAIDSAVDRHASDNAPEMDDWDDGRDYDSERKEREEYYD